MLTRRFPCTSMTTLTLGVTLLGSLLGGCGPTSFLITPVPADRALDEQTVLRESVWAQDRIALIDIDGVLQNKHEASLLGPAGEHPVSLLTEKLRQAATDKRVRAIVLRINSPGGTVTASDLMYTEVQRFKQRTGKPVIACMLDVAASGGYYIACAADHIIAHPTTVTGSIGVILVLPEFSGTMQKLGVAVNVVKSGAMKDAGSMFRDLAPQDRAMFQKLIDGMYARFVDVVHDGRPQIEPDRLKELADGRVFLAGEARDAGLVDQVGTLREAIRAAKQAAGIADRSVKVVRYVRPLQWRPNIYAHTPTPSPVSLVNVELPDWLEQSAPQMMYLWAPGW